MIAEILVILLWILIIPMAVGLVIPCKYEGTAAFFIKTYLCGMVLYLAAFELIALSNMFTVNDFRVVVQTFSVVMWGLSILGLLVFILRIVKKKDLFKKGTVAEAVCKQKRIENIVLWIIFGLSVMFQIIQSLRLTYPDGDDAYYVGTATYGADIPEMYSKIPYTGMTTTMDTRHALAPFSYLISFFVRQSGMSAATIAHSVFPIWFLLCAYGIYFLIAREVCRERREISLFMLLISVLFMFGNYSVYSMETFLMTRIRQGKASLGSFAIPFGLYLLFYLARNLEGKRRERVLCYVLMACNALAAALFTTMGNLIYPCMLLAGGLCICFSKKDWKKLIFVGLTCVPNFVLAAIFLIIR